MEPVAALAEAAGYPLLAEPTSQMRWSHDPPSGLVSGYTEIARGRPEALAPELIVRVGELPTSKPLRQWLESIEGLRQIVIDPDGGLEGADAARRDPACRPTRARRPPASPSASRPAPRPGARPRPDPAAGWHDAWMAAEERVASRRPRGARCGVAA